MSKRCIATHLETRESKGDHTLTLAFPVREYFSNQMLRKRDKAESSCLTKQRLMCRAVRRLGFGKGSREKGFPPLKI